MVYVRRTVRKNVEFYSKNKFEKLVHLVGFIIRVYGRVKTRNAIGTNKEFALSLKDLKGRRLIAGLPTRRPAFRPSPVHMGTFIGQNVITTDFSQSTSVFAYRHYSTNAPYTFVLHRRCIILAIGSVFSNALQGRNTSLDWAVIL